MRSFAQAYNFATMQIAGKKFPRVYVGTSPFIGSSQFGERVFTYHQQFLDNPKAISAVLVECIKMGCNAVQAIAYPVILEAIRLAQHETQTEVFVFASVGVGDIQTEIASLAEFKPRGVVIHGSYTDKNFAGVQRHLRMAKDRLGNVVTGIATHTPGFTLERALTIPEVEVVWTPYNASGMFMRPSQEMTLEAIESTRKARRKIFATKPLAAGTLRPDEAIAYLKGKVDGLAVGLATTTEVRETFEVLRRYFPHRKR